MSLTLSIPRRALKHTRVIHIKAFVRGNGLWDTDAYVIDIKSADLYFPYGNFRVGALLHNLWLRLTLDRQFIDVEANSAAVPYPGYCNTIDPDYKKLVGSSLVKSSRHALKERIGSTVLLYPSDQIGADISDHRIAGFLAAR